MKKSIGIGVFFVLFLLKSINIYGQPWLDIAINGSSGLGLFSTIEIYDDTRIDFSPRATSNLSMKVGLNLTETEALVLDFGFVNRNFHLEQKQLESTSDLVQLVDFGFSGFRILPMYRHTKDEGYFEIGPEFGFVQSQYYTDEANGPIPKDALFKEKTLRGAIGFGGYLIGNERVTLVSGLRILYDFNDLRSEKAAQEKFPYQNYEQQNDLPFKAIDIQLSLELNISLGFLVRSSCGKRKVMFKW